MAHHSYVMVQVFVSFSIEPSVPVLIRANLHTSLTSLVHQVLLKLADTKTCGALPHNYLGGYNLYHANGDGTSDRSKGLMVLSDTIEDCLAFPYMVHLGVRRGTLTEVQQGEPLPETVLAAFGLPPTAAPRPLPPDVKELRSALMKFCGLTDDDVNKFGPRGQLAPNASEQLKVQQAMILRRREDVIAKRVRHRAQVEEQSIQHCADRDEMIREELRLGQERRDALKAHEETDPSYHTRQKLVNDVTRLRHKLESDISRSGISHSASSTVGRKPPTPEVQNAPTKAVAKTPPPSESRVPREVTLKNIVSALDASILLEAVAMQERQQRDRDLRAKNAIQNQKQVVAKAVHQAQSNSQAAHDAETKRLALNAQVREAELARKTKCIVGQSRVEEHTQYQLWKERRAKSLGPVYARAELTLLQK